MRFTPEKALHRIREHTLALYLFAAAAVALAIWLRLQLKPLLDGHSTFATLFLAVLVAAFLGGLRPALFAVLLGAVGGSIFLLPAGAPSSEPASLGALVVYVATALGIAVLAGSLHAARQRAEHNAASLRRHAHLIDQTYDAVIVWSQARGIELWNGGAERMYGHRDVDAMGRSPAEVLRPESHATPDAIACALRTYGSWEGEVRHRHRNGQPVYVDSRMVLVREDGHEYVLEVNRNIDDRARMEQALREANEHLEARVSERTLALAEANERLRASEDGLRLLVEGVSEHVVVLLDPDGVIRTWNSGTEHIVGYSAAEVLGQRYDCLFTPEDIAGDVPANELVRAAAEGKIDIDGWRRRRNGSRFWVQGTLAAVYDERGAVRGFAKVTRDLTAKRHNDQLLQSVLDSTLDGILCIDARGTVSMINRAGERIFDRTAAEVVGHNVSMIMPPPYRDEHDDYLANYIATGDARIIGIGREVRGQRRDGTLVPIDLAVTEFRLDEERHFVGLLRDLSERKKLEAQLRQSQKMEAFGQLAGGVAHDFNNVLTVISGYSELLLQALEQGPRDGDASRRMVLEIRAAGERAAALTRQLLAFSRQQVLEPRVLDLNAIVAGTEKMLGRLIGEDVDLVVQLEGNLPRVLVDEGQIEQVIVNLAVNARDAMPQGGKLTIATRVVELDEPHSPTHPDARSGRFVMLSVTDNGAGMTPDVRARVFEPFFTTKGVGRGTGLGLAVVHGIVRQSGGSVDVYSEIGVGSSFKIYLPIADDDHGESLTMQAATSRRGNETILLVEDELSVREMASVGLSIYGYRVLTATNGEDALRMLSTHAGEVDMLVTDVVMPEMSGRRLGELVKASYPAMRVLFMSGYTDDAVVRHGILRAGEAFLQKPFTPSTLARKVREVLDADTGST